MAKAVAKRNVGIEILEGLRELRRGEIGRVAHIPSVSVIRERNLLPNPGAAPLVIAGYLVALAIT